PPPALEQARRVATLPQLRDPQLDRPHTRVPFPGPIPVAVRDSIRGPFMPLRADLLGHLELHQGFCQDPHRLPKEVHICSGLAKQLLKCDHKVGGHDRNLLAVCFAYTHGTRLWPLLSRGGPHPGIYTTTWYSNRTLDTLVGPVTYRRRRYRDRAGRYRYLLDEALSLNKRQRVSPGLAAELVMQATDQPFREAATHRKELGLPSVVSHATIHRWTRKLGQLRCQEQEQRREAVFEAGEQQPWARGRDRVVFSEADELFVKAQREKVDRIGIKASITHSGWEPRYSGSKEWRLTERHV